MPNINDVKCMLIIGSTSGLGRALALSILDLPSKPTVIVCGRRQERLDELVSSHGADGRLRAVKLDVNTDRQTLKAAIDDITRTYPDFDAVMFSSGVQCGSDFSKPETIDLDGFLTEIHTNYTSVLMMITFFLPHLISLGESGRPTFLYTISSGLAIMPSPSVANYSAAKAAIHSLSMALNVQLKEKNVHVVEILPPLVESELHDGQGTTEKLSKVWMPLTEFTKLTMEQLITDAAQIPIGMVAHLYQQHEAGRMEATNKFFEFQKAQINQ
ncbi:NAD(P)-binding protein [Pisolithus orientalis]|uniref:NAD(P)-binding protein n=1 Tax=Pisolithus orientalis TaxID=936130 RepID=UPI00222568D4|nr:NAD(P)-binding protein [Pisolithus orientalis]KAI6001096.1 NAD(P)-binding protein [Pisolithus orientalis]